MLILETVINRYLALDPEMQDRIAAFSGKVIKFDIIGMDKGLYLFPGQHGMQIKTGFDGHADTTLTGTPLSLFKMGLVSDTAQMLLKGEVVISGDTRLGHQFKNTFSQMDIDWTEPLANLFGDVAAYQLGHSIKQFGLWGKESVKSVSASFAEYLQEESRDVVSEAELQMFNAAVDELRDDVDRLQARLEQTRLALKPARE